MLGSSPFARALVRSTDGPVAWLHRELPEPGRWLSRRVDPASGEGVRLALKGLGGLLVVLDGEEALHGLVLVARNQPDLPIGLVAPHGTPWPEGTTGWARLRLGLPWGPGEPLYDRWASAGRLGREVTVADPGPIAIVPMDGAIACARALLDAPGAEWSWLGETSTFPTLATALVGEARVSRAWFADRWLGPDAARLRNHLGRPGGSRDTPGWEPPPVAEASAV